MKKTLLLLVMLALQACSDPTARPPTADVHNGNDMSSKLEPNTIQSSSDMNTGIDVDAGAGADTNVATGIYFSDRKCDANKTCKY